MLGRRKTSVQEPPAAVQGPGKNRPTPKRAQSEAARRQPLVPTARAAAGKGDKAGKKAAREAARLERVRAREAMMAGDERALTPRDRGPARRYARGVVDARWNLGELLLPVMVGVLLLSFIGAGLRAQYPSLYGIALVLTYVLVLVALLDALWMALRLRKVVAARFGDTASKGLLLYAVMRAFQLRRTRVPRPQVRRGQPPA